MIVRAAARPPSTTYSNSYMEPQRRRLAVMAVVGIIVFFVVYSSSGHHEEETFASMQHNHPASSLDECKLSPIVPPSAEAAAKARPFWVPSYPSSDLGVVSAMVMHMTGEFTASKNYYASSPIQKKCYSAQSVTVICEQIHPIVDIGNAPLTQASKYNPQLIFPLRNPRSAIPQHVQDKAVKYHNQQGQISVDYWRDFRDHWLEQAAVKEWASVIGTWKNYTPYSAITPLYLPYEDLLNATAGVALVTQLATLIRDAGFAVVSPTNATDMKCVWYQAMKFHWQHQQPLYEYATDYIPAYTKAQKTFMSLQLAQLRDLYPNDAALTTILNRYRHDVLADPIQDVPAAAPQKKKPKI
jgi:hypothetical protein